MITSKCSTRISLFGGPSDLQESIDRFGFGSVISFPCNIYSYISLSRDKYGCNTHNDFLINYTKREEEKNIKDIKNDIARVVLDYFNCGPVTLNFHSDVFSSGSGLASSSAYLIACISCVADYMNIRLSSGEICNLALKLERKFNPLTGYQDIYGCGLNGFKKLTFKKDKTVHSSLLNDSFLNNFNIFLKPTNIKRSSTEVLSTIDIEKCEPILKLVDKAFKAITQNNTKEFIELFKESWKYKKQTSPLILQNPELKQMDTNLEDNYAILAHKLCGAGNGGYFLIFTNKEYEEASDEIKINVSENCLIKKRI
tara:strand:- start:241 stop:1176 length:936 start_codon:yes stop_codon:yes gene_type:complete